MVTSKSALDVAKIKKNFPIFERTVHNKPLCYLDNAATSQKPIQVIEAMTDFYKRYNANVHRSLYELGEEATQEYEKVREKVAGFINAKYASEIVFTKGTTESINLVAYGWGIKGKIRKGDNIVSTVMEHHSNLIPWFFVRDYSGVELSWIDIDEEGYLNMEDLDKLITDKTKLVAIAHISNVLGTINPIKDIARRAHEVGALCLVDAAQSVPHLPVDVQDLDCDLLAFSGHKMLGPTGIGVLYGKQKVLEDIEPLLGGGEMIHEVHLGTARWSEVPGKFEGGTPNMGGVIGLGASIDYLNSLGMENIRNHEIDITTYAIDTLSKIKGIKLYGPPDMNLRGGIISFTMDGIHPHDIAAILDAEGIAIRSGHNCAQPLMDRYNLIVIARASFYVYNTFEDVDRLVKALIKVQEVFA